MPRGRPRKTAPTADGQTTTDDNKKAPKAELTDEQRRGLYVVGIAKLERLNAAKDEAVAAIRLHRKTMKSDGFSPEEVNYGLWLRKQPEAVAIEDANQRARVARWLAHPLGHQATLFDDTGALLDRTPGDDRAFEEGKVDGFEGKPASPRYDATSPQGQRYLAGWQVGQAALAANFKPTDPEDDDDPRPRFLKERGMPGADKAVDKSELPN